MTYAEFRTQFDRNIYEQFWLEETILADSKHPHLQSAKIKHKNLEKKNKELDYEYNVMLPHSEPIRYEQLQKQKPLPKEGEVLC